MKIQGWAYLGVGIFISALSGYLYKFVPKPDGTPNMSMAAFFFIGIIFILIGFIKLFFKKMDKDEEIKFQKAREELEKTKHMSNYSHKNRVEEHINKVYQQASNQTQSSNTPLNNTQSTHSSSYAKTHPFHQAHQDTHHQHIPNHNIVVCKKCSNKNSPTANYCHSCGYRLR